MVRTLDQLHDAVDAAQPLQHRYLMPQPLLRARTQRLLADAGAPGKYQPSHTHALALMHDFGLNG
jgi:hypothetical protein